MSDDIKEMVGGSALILINSAIVGGVVSGMPFGLVGNYFIALVTFYAASAIAFIVIWVDKYGRSNKCKRNQVTLRLAISDVDEPEYCNSRGVDVPESVGMTLYNALRRKSYDRIGDKKHPTPLEVLESAGFDLKTLRIEIKHKDFIDE